ncbi:MAG: cytochrome c [Flavobacteriales bacterium]|jgi:mono/diheme cytochrome c family protein
MVTNKKFTLNTVKAFALMGITAFAMACGGSETPATGGTTTPAAVEKTPEAAAPMAGLITADEVKLGPIDQGMVAKGKEIYDVKCQACHSLGTNRVVGPGWKGVAEQRKPEWILNMIVHTDAMLESDEAAQAMLEECLVRMPNQNLSKDEAREVLEFMRTLEAEKAS